MDFWGTAKTATRNKFPKTFFGLSLTHFVHFNLAKEFAGKFILFQPVSTATTQIILTKATGILVKSKTTIISLHNETEAKAP